MDKVQKPISLIQQMSSEPFGIHLLYCHLHATVWKTKHLFHAIGGQVQISWKYVGTVLAVPNVIARQQFR
jgi:hypothetical protein